MTGKQEFILINTVSWFWIQSVLHDMPFAIWQFIACGILIFTQAAFIYYNATECLKRAFHLDIIDMHSLQGYWLAQGFFFGGEISGQVYWTIKSAIRSSLWESRSESPIIRQVRAVQKRPKDQSTPTGTGIRSGHSMRIAPMRMLTGQAESRRNTRTSSLASSIIRPGVARSGKIARIHTPPTSIPKKARNGSSRGWRRSCGRPTGSLVFQEDVIKSVRIHFGGLTDLGEADVTASGNERKIPLPRMKFDEWRNSFFSKLQRKRPSEINWLPKSGISRKLAGYSFAKGLFGLFCGRELPK